MTGLLHRSGLLRNVEEERHILHLVLLLLSCVSLFYRVLYKHDLQDQSLRAGLQKAQCQSALQPIY